MLMRRQEIRIALLRFVPARVLHKGVVTTQVHRHGCAADGAVRHQLSGNPHILLRFDHLTHGLLVIVGLGMAGF